MCLAMCYVDVLCVVRFTDLSLWLKISLAVLVVYRLVGSISASGVAAKHVRDCRCGIKCILQMCPFRSLKWKVHPPTAYSFAKHLLFLLPFGAVPMNTRHDILELSRFLTELCVIDYYFVVHRPSDVALASLLNAMEDIPSVSEEIIRTFVDEVARLTGIHASRPEVAECRSRLGLLYSQGGYTRPTNQSMDTRNESISPVCVAYGVNPFSSPHAATSTTGNVPKTADGMYGAASGVAISHPL